MRPLSKKSRHSNNLVGEISSLYFTLSPWAPPSTTVLAVTPVMILRREYLGPLYTVISVKGEHSKTVISIQLHGPNWGIDRLSVLLRGHTLYSLGFAVWEPAVTLLTPSMASQVCLYYTLLIITYVLIDLSPTQKDFKQSLIRTHLTRKSQNFILQSHANQHQLQTHHLTNMTNTRHPTKCNLKTPLARSWAYGNVPSG